MKSCLLSADVAQGHSGDCGGDGDHPRCHLDSVPTSCATCKFVFQYRVFIFSISSYFLIFILMEQNKNQMKSIKRKESIEAVWKNRPLRVLFDKSFDESILRHNKFKMQ